MTAPVSFFELLHPEVVLQAKRKPAEIEFIGLLKQEGESVFVEGGNLNRSLKSFSLEPYGNSDTWALFLQVNKGWGLIGLLVTGMSFMWTRERTMA